MNILFILGNGFDLSLGLDTSYKSFLKHYLNNHQPTSNSLIADFKNEIWDNLDTWADFEICLGQWLNDGKVEDRAIAIHDDLVNELSLYMKKEQERLRPQAKVREQILSNMANVSQFLWRNLDTRDVDKYILNHVNVMPHQINTITLNYTDSFERLALGEDKNEALCKANNIRFHFNNPIHLHGTVAEGIVLGLNDESQVRNKRLIILNSIKSRFIKLSTVNNVYRTGYEEQAMTAIDAAHMICVYGTSFGATDKRIWQRIVNRVVKDNIQVILFHHGDVAYGGNDGPKKVDELERLNRTFVSFGISSGTDQPVSIPSSVLGVYNSSIFDVSVDVAIQKPVYEPDEAEILARTMETLKEALNPHS